MKNETNLSEKLENAVDKQFPKGDPARGRALVVVAIAQMQIDEELAKKKEQYKKLYAKMQKVGAWSIIGNNGKEQTCEWLRFFEEIFPDCVEKENQRSSR